MTIFNLKPNSKIHMIGIGGVSMSALSELLLSFGYKLSGSDRVLSNFTKKLSDLGIDVKNSHDLENVHGADLVCYSSAISKDNPELVEAERRGILLAERCELLGEILKLYQKSIAVAGTHGKTTVTSMLSNILLCANFDPSILVGAEFSKIGGTLRVGGRDYLIFEACEYVESFLKFWPYCEIITNIEADHLDYYKDLNHIISSFGKFMQQNSPSGAIFANVDDKNVEQALAYAVPASKVIKFGVENENSDYLAKDINLSKYGAFFSMYLKSEKIADISLKICGIHNVYNALAAACCAHFLGVKPEFIKFGLHDFSGAERRFEMRGHVNGFTVIDDYAHHPTEIKTTLTMAKHMGYNKVWCIFQPHTYTRTVALLDDFAVALSLADHVIITDIYAAREQNLCGIKPTDLSGKIDGAIYISGFENIKNYVLKNAAENDLVITMGAGDVTKLGPMIVGDAGEN